MSTNFSESSNAKDTIYGCPNVFISFIRATGRPFANAKILINCNGKSLAFKTNLQGTIIYNHTELSETEATVFSRTQKCNVSWPIKLPPEPGRYSIQLNIWNAEEQS